MQTGDTGNAAAPGPTRIEGWLSGLSAVAVAAMCVLITVTVLSRWLYSGIIPDDVLLVRELMVAVILLPLAAVSARRDQIAVSIFTDRLSGRPRMAIALIGDAVGILFIGALLFAGMRLFADSWGSGDYYDGDIYIPMWFGHAVYVAGLGAFLARLIANGAGDLKRLAASRPG